MGVAESGSATAARARTHARRRAALADPAPGGQVLREALLVQRVTGLEPVRVIEDEIPQRRVDRAAVGGLIERGRGVAAVVDALDEEAALGREIVLEGVAEILEVEQVLAGVRRPAPED